MLLSLALALFTGGVLWGLFTDSEQQLDLSTGVLRLALFPALFGVLLVFQHRRMMQRRISDEDRSSG